MVVCGGIMFLQNDVVVGFFFSKIELVLQKTFCGISSMKRSHRKTIVLPLKNDFWTQTMFNTWVNAFDLLLSDALERKALVHNKISLGSDWFQVMQVNTMSRVDTMSQEQMCLLSVTLNVPHTINEDDTEEKKKIYRAIENFYSGLTDKLTDEFRQSRTFQDQEAKENMKHALCYFVILNSKWE